MAGITTMVESDDIQAEIHQLERAMQDDEHAQRDPGITDRLRRWFRTWYDASIERQRHMVEEDARRLHGHVVWED